MFLFFIVICCILLFTFLSFLLKKSFSRIQNHQAPQKSYHDDSTLTRQPTATTTNTISVTQPYNNTVFYSRKTHKPVAAYKNGEILYYAEGLNEWFPMGSCKNGEIYNKNGCMIGRVEEKDGIYHCILDFCNLIDSSIDYYKEWLEKHPRDSTALGIIEQRKSHIDKIDVAYITEQGYLRIHDHLLDPRNPFHVLDITNDSPIYRLNNKPSGNDPNFELAATFICIQNESSIEDSSCKPFESLYESI